MTGRVLLVRHPPVARAWAGRCYGRSEMGWSRPGTAMASTLADTLAGKAAALIVHSGARRTRRLAEMIADRTGAPLHCDARWLERDFGSWEGRSWNAIWRETGTMMDRMVSDPDGFRPGDGETTTEMATRACAAWHHLPTHGTTIVVAHGGPIAAVRAMLANVGIGEMLRFVPPCGATVELERVKGTRHCSKWLIADV